jgi:exodeoxyribonuclease V alpha subunit
VARRIGCVPRWQRPLYLGRAGNPDLSMPGVCGEIMPVTENKPSISGQSSTETDPAAAISGIILRLTFQNNENGFCVAKMQPDNPVGPQYQLPGGVVALVGIMPGIDVGQTIRAEGEWLVDRKYGPQFKVSWYKPSLPVRKRGIIAYLSSGSVKGIGPKTAEKIFDHFGESTFEIMDQHIDRLAEVPKIGRKTLSRIKAAWREAQGDRELITFLGEHGISPAVASRLRKAYGESALSIVKSNPYRLVLDIRGIGFRRADEIARQIGLPPDSPDRITAAVSHILQSQADLGHTYQPRRKLDQLVVELIDVPVENVHSQVDHLISRKMVSVETIDDETAVFLNIFHDAENRIAYRFRKLAGCSKRLPRIDAVAALADFEQRTRFHLAGKQREAVLQFTRKGMMILTGGPGTGKTTTVRSIIEMYRLGGLRVRLSAPTGRAAKRLSETTRIEAETVHRLLGYKAHLHQFTHDATNPLETDLLIVDEISMLDVQLAACLFEAVSPSTCVLLVGDEDQLPSVGAGQVLGDLIASECIPVARLTEVFRQAGSSLIVTNAHRINRGLMPYPEPPDTADRGKTDYFFIERDDTEQVLETVITMARDRIPLKFNMDPVRDIQVLSPMRKGDLGVEYLNSRLQDVFNKSAAGQEVPGPGGLVAGDRVMQVSNNYDKHVFNGDIGLVRQVIDESREVHVAFDDRSVIYLVDEAQEQLSLAYATTIHKSQGSEYPCVIIPVHTCHWIMLQRNLIYTALTRARRLAVLVGTRKAMRRAVANAERSRRFTALNSFIRRLNHGS